MRRALTATSCVTAQRLLNIHEYAAKMCMHEYDIPTEKGFVASNAEESQKAVSKIGTPQVMVKAQILAGGRGKGEVHTTSGAVIAGGVQKCPNHPAALQMAKSMLGAKLVTKQTGPAGQIVRMVYITETVKVASEKYVAMLLDRKTCCPLFIGCAEGGMSIEDVAAATPEKIHRMAVDLSEGIQREKCIEFAQRLGIENAEKAADIFINMYNLAKQKDCTMVEVNPLAELVGGDVICLDAKVTVDDNAEFRQRALWEQFQDLGALDEREVAAHKAELTYVALDGNVGCIVNGAGLAMATMDMIAAYGAKPANFLDTGGNATAPQIEAALRIITSDDSVACILVNIFGGITHCDRIADGIIQGIRQVGANFKTPVVVRLEGTHSKEGQEKVAAAAKEGLPIIPVASLDEACAKAAEFAAKKK